MVPGTVPQAVATPGDRELSVTWSAPSNEGSALKGYTVALSPGGQQQSVTGTSATFTGLTNGSAYTVVVKAENAEAVSDLLADDPFRINNVLADVRIVHWTPVIGVFAE